MRKGVKSFVFFIVVLVVGSLITIGIQNPLLFNRFFSDIFSSFKDFFYNLETNDLIFLIALVILVIFGTFLVVSKIRYKSKKDRVKRKARKKRIEKKIKSKRGIYTKLDLLYSEIKDKKETEVPEISKKLETSEEKIIEWGKMLEKEDLVSIEYPTFKHPIIKLKEKKEEREEDKEEPKSNQKGADKKSSSKSGQGQKNSTGKKSKKSKPEKKSKKPKKKSRKSKKSKTKKKSKGTKKSSKKDKK